MERAHFDLVILHGRFRREIRRGSLVRVKHGVAIRLADAANDLEEWEKRELVTRARILAVAATMRTAIVLTHNSAAILHGIETWGMNPEVSFSAASRLRARPLPAVIIGGTEIPGSRTRPMVDTIRRETTTCCEGLEASTLEDTAVDCALDLPPLEAFVIIAGILRKLSAFDRFDLTASRARERRARAAVVQRLDEVSADSPRRESARLLVSLADAACETIGERVLHFVLITLFPAIMTTQVEVRTNGKRYFLDVAIMDLKIAFEFDGVIKMGNDSREFRDAQAKLLARQRDLEDAGWTVIRVGWGDLLDLSKLRDKLFRRIIAVAKRPLIPDSQTQDLWSRQISHRHGERTRAAERRRP